MNDQRTSLRAILRQPPTRREALLFGLLVLALAWLMMSLHPTRIISVPDVATSTTMLVQSSGSRFI
jgi:hypothetical protein